MHGTIETIFRVEWRPIIELQSHRPRMADARATRGRAKCVLRTLVCAGRRRRIRPQRRRRSGLVPHGTGALAGVLSRANRTPQIRLSSAGARGLDASLCSAWFAACRSVAAAKPSSMRGSSMSKATCVFPSSCSCPTCQPKGEWRPPSMPSSPVVTAGAHTSPGTPALCLRLAASARATSNGRSTERSARSCGGNAIGSLTGAA